MAGRNLKFMLAKYFVFLQGYLLKKEKSAEFCIRLAAQVTKSYFRRLPAIERFYRETKFTLLK